MEAEGFIHNLRSGDGELLKDGTGDHPGGRTLKGRYIVRVGWDDVRGWFSEVSPPRDLPPPAVLPQRRPPFARARPPPLLREAR